MSLPGSNAECKLSAKNLCRSVIEAGARRSPPSQFAHGGTSQPSKKAGDDSSSRPPPEPHLWGILAACSSRYRADPQFRLGPSRLSSVEDTEIWQLFTCDAAKPIADPAHPCRPG